MDRGSERKARFEREAHAVAALNHPNICTLHDVGHDGNVDFLVMELVDGESLASHLATKGALPLDEALALGIEVCDALEKAHAHGIVHRDIKPGNLMLARTASGASLAFRAKMLDFGLARIVSAPAGVGELTRPVSTPMTAAGMLLGTPQ